MFSPLSFVLPRVSGARRRAPEAGAAFSLVEVVLALGIVSFAFVAVFGLLPVGMGTFREAIDTTVGSQVIHRLINEAQQTDFSSLIATPEFPVRNFDDQGNEVPPGATGFAADYLYSAQVLVVAPTTLPNASTPPSPSLATILVKLARNRAHLAAPFAPGSRLPCVTQSALIARNQ